jgi:hypothetical protein
MRRRHTLRFAALTFGCVVFGCSKLGEENRTDPTNGTGSVKNWAFTVSASKDNFTLETAATDTTILTVTRTGGFTGAVTFDLVTLAGPDAGVTLTTEAITQTGAITTTRLIAKIGSAHVPVNDFKVRIHAQPASDEVMGQFLDLTFNIVRKPGIFITVPATLSIGKGQLVSASVSFTRTSFDAAVPMNIIGAPAGVSATFSPNPVAGTSTQMTIAADPSVPEGVYNIGVRGNEGLPGQGTAPLALTVTAPGTFTVSLSTSTLSVPKNSTVPMAVNITRSNFTGPVTFTLSGVPGGVTATFATNPVTANTVQLSFTNNTGISGTYQILITAASAGAPNVQVALTLNVS